MLKETVDLKNTNIEKAMIGYIKDNGDISAIEPTWNLGDPEHLGQFLINNWPTREHAIQLIDKGGIGVLDFKKNDYEYVDGFGAVVDNRVSFHPENYRSHIQHLYLWMKGEWQYSDCGIDWTPVKETIKEVA
jgi:hypothetical protein